MIHEKKGIKVEVMGLSKVESQEHEQEHEYQEVHVETAAQQLLEI